MTRRRVWTRRARTLRLRGLSMVLKALIALAVSGEAQLLEDLGGCEEVARFVAAGRLDTSRSRLGPYYFFIRGCSLSARLLWRVRS